MSSSKKLAEIGSLLIDFSGIASEEDVFETILSALRHGLEIHGLSEEKSVVEDIRKRIEQHYKLPEDSLINSFKKKDRYLTEPKLIWVIICLKIFNNERSKVENLISNGCSYQYIYMCHRKFQKLDSKYKVDRDILSNYKAIIETYEPNL